MAILNTWITDNFGISYRFFITDEETARNLLVIGDGIHNGIFKLEILNWLIDEEMGHVQISIIAEQYNGQEIFYKFCIIGMPDDAYMKFKLTWL